MSEWPLSGCLGKHCGVIEVDARHEEQRTRGNSWQRKQPVQPQYQRHSAFALPRDHPLPAVCGYTCLDALGPWLLGQDPPSRSSFSQKLTKLF